MGRWAIPVVLATAASVVGAILLAPYAVRAFVGGVELTVDGFVWFGASLSTGMSIWSVLRRVMGAAARFVVSPEATIVLAGLVIIGAAAAYGLQRVLGSEPPARREPRQES
jgi:hypothetical protein